LNGCFLAAIIEEESEERREKKQKSIWIMLSLECLSQSGDEKTGQVCTCNFEKSYIYIYMHLDIFILYI
jgi:hypothetical protein